MARHSVDSLVSSVESEMLGGDPVKVAPVEQKENDVPQEKVATESKPDQEAKTQDDPYLEPSKEVESDGESKPDQEEIAQTESDSGDMDEYGTPTQKAKMYTEEELQQRIRERLSRGQHNQQQQQQVQQQAAQDGGFQYDKDSNETWEQQLEAFVERTLHKVSQKQAETQWKAQEAEKHAKFEDKFTTGMSKYQDFKDVVGKRNITNAMLQATKALDNPAAFVYAASKLHPQEVDRIAGLTDPTEQMVAIGRLEERMKKAKAVTQAKRPVKVPSGDIPDKASGKRNIDDLIRQDEKRVMKSRGR